MNSLGGFLQVIIVRIETQNLKIDLVFKLLELLNKLSTNDNCRQGMLLILNGLLNTVSTDQIKNLSDTVLKVIHSTVNDQSANGQPCQFDQCCKRIATGLIQDLCNGLGNEVVPYLEKITSLLFSILQDPNIHTDVKIHAIKAIGEVCFAAEHEFEPYLDHTMTTLINAGKLSMTKVDTTLPKEDQLVFH
jgi:hypothetical protein